MRLFTQKDPVYRAAEWQVTETQLDKSQIHHNETVFSLANGYMGLRGVLEEGVPKSVVSTRGAYINGIYETSPIVYGESMAQQPQCYQTMITVFDWAIMELFIDNERFSMFTGYIKDYQRTLDFQHGILQRQVHWVSPKGKEVRIYIERMLSLTDPHRACIHYQIIPLNFTGNIKIKSAVNGDVKNKHFLKKKALKTLRTESDVNEIIISQTKNTKFNIGCGMSHVVYDQLKLVDLAIEKEAQSESIHYSVSFNAEQGKLYTIDKYVVLATDREINISKLTDFIGTELEFCVSDGYIQMRTKQKQFLDNFWDNIDIKINGDPYLQQGMRFNAFHLIQSIGRDQKTSIAAKGLTGEFYEGHYFWDTEIYIVPVFLYSHPELVKNVLMYRYNILDQARDNAARMGDKGALYPWRTIDGHEASGNFLGSTVQCHINADITYAIDRYVIATEDYDFLIDYGAEIVFETARMWAGRGAFIEAKGGRYCINEVCGPDEYKPGVNNNCYTNYMAKYNLEVAVQTAQFCNNHYPQQYKQLVQKIELTEAEIAQWRKCAEKMYLPYDDKLQIHPQDDSFITKDPINISNISKKDFPLVKNWHPLVIWRYQVLKQADVVLLLLLLSDNFSIEEKKRNFDYYEPKTTHDSSLSLAVHGIIAAEIGYYDMAYNYFMRTIRLDLDDYLGNAWQGIHTANMGGSWMCMIHGFAGLRVINGCLYFRPILPVKWQDYSFKIRFKGRKLLVFVRPCEVEYQLEEGSEITIYHCKKSIILTPDCPSVQIKMNTIVR